jgi:hypothetical protein
MAELLEDCFEGDDVFKSMDAECKVCIQKTR